MCGQTASAEPSAREPVERARGELPYGRLDAHRSGVGRGRMHAASLVPQVMKAWSAADREAISKRTYAVASAAYSLWIVHGVMIGSMPIIVFNALALVLGAAILVLKLRDPPISRNA